MISIATLQTSQEDATLATAALIIVILETASMVLLTVASATASALVKGLVLVVIVPRPDSVASVVETLAALVADSAVVLMAALVDSAVVLAAHHNVAPVDSADEAADSVTAVAPKYSTSTMKSARMSVTATAATSELISYL